MAPLLSCRVNDWLLKINDVDLTNKDRKQVIKAVLNGGGVINMVVRRRKSLGGRLVTPIHINLMGHKGIDLRPPARRLVWAYMSSVISALLISPRVFSVSLSPLSLSLSLSLGQTVALCWRVGCS